MSSSTCDWRTELLLLVLLPHFDLWRQREERRRQSWEHQGIEEEPNWDSGGPMVRQCVLELPRHSRQWVSNPDCQEDNPLFEDVIRAYEEDR